MLLQIVGATMIATIFVALFWFGCIVVTPKK